MKNNKKFDFSGYATKNDLKCADGRTIRHGAFKDNDGEKVPLVWQHMHNDPNNILGHAILEDRADGVYAYCKFNDTEAGRNAKQLVIHGDIDALSIFANKLVQKGSDVIHGAIREVSLVLSGANPGAFIDNVVIAHSDGSSVESSDEVVIFTDGGLSLDDVDYVEHAENSQNGSSEGDRTIGDVFDEMTDEQKNVVYAMLAEVGSEIEHSDDEGGYEMKKNVFDNSEDKVEGAVLSHSDIVTIMDNAKQCGSLKEAVLAHAQTYGIEDIDILFPDAKTVTPTPDFIKRDDSWVTGVLSGTRHTPFSRIKSTAADITAEEARARGYIKGNLKKEEVIKLLKRITTPTTIYKKQKLDRDDIIDITDMNVVAWLKAEMRMMLDEELARAVLIGDGREADSEDKINEENIRPISKDADMYAHKVQVGKDTTTEDLIEAIIRSRKNYKGSGNPTFYTTTDVVTDMLLLNDKMGRRLYPTLSELAATLRVKNIVEVEVMENQTRSDDKNQKFDLLGIIVNLNDYVIGADKGGQVSMFDDFDIDYNQYKYLIETRCSGALIHPKSALVIEKSQVAGTGE